RRRAWKNRQASWSGTFRLTRGMGGSSCMNNRGTAERLAIEDRQAQVVDLHVVRENQAQPLRECAEVALRRYFRDLDGHVPANLYTLVINEVEEPLLRAVLEFTRGNQSRAAEILG